MRHAIYARLSPLWQKGIKEDFFADVISPVTAQISPGPSFSNFFKEGK
jgi:hypothetical protein